MGLTTKRDFRRKGKVFSFWGVWGLGLSSLGLISFNFSMIFRHKGTLLGEPKPSSGGGGGGNIGAGGLWPSSIYVKKALPPLIFLYFDNCRCNLQFCRGNF